MTNRSGWRLIAEGSAIVLSILLAFTIDAWWEQYQEREQLESKLESVLEELTAMKFTLSGDRRTAEAIVESSARLLRSAGNPDDNPLKLEEFDKLIGDLTFYNNGSHWSYPALNSIVNGKEISTIDNLELAKKLVRLQGRVLQLMSFYASDHQFHLTTWSDFAIGNIDWPQLSHSVRHSPGNPDEAYPYPEFPLAEITDQRELLGRTDFQTLVILKMERQLDMLGDMGFDPVEEVLDDTIAEIEAELGI